MTSNLKSESTETASSMSIERLKADKEAASSAEVLTRLTELKKFLSTNTNPGNLRRLEEVEEEIKRIVQRLEELKQIT